MSLRLTQELVLLEGSFNSHKYFHLGVMPQVGSKDAFILDMIASRVLSCGCSNI